MRQRFEENRNIQDMRVAKELINKAEEELFLKQHWHPRKCKFSVLWPLRSQVKKIQALFWIWKCKTFISSSRFFVLCEFAIINCVAVPDSPGGVAYEREVRPPDWVVDYWHPLEKAQYPEYFARREQRKQEYIKNWEKKYGKSIGTSSH